MCRLQEEPQAGEQLELQQMKELEASLLDMPEDSEVDDQATQVIYLHWTSLQIY